MLTKDSSDKEILDYDMGGVIIRDMTGITFAGIIANKINGLPAYKAATQELVALVSSPPLGKIPELEKVKAIRKLLELEVQI